jgi:hypothetical protein
MTEAKQMPRVLDDPDSRARARATRDHNWEIARRIAEHGTLWICWWNKDGHHQKPYPDDLLVCGLITGCEIAGWLNTHPDWWLIGEWDDARYAAPVAITEAGRQALAEWEKYDMEPVEGGLVEPGWICTPAEREEVK